ncbi:hypothetical protein GUJ93_ZPchr0013g36456 [Zizania palustris]|uniref:Uncharacterized protein n=1 Tax=Zizania palustris TaxID=103762 RepID=A0A8J5WV42_ZIZPA|nr:hypothetical protein GUJ93_ZPchr0013g36456 [Zizania palustris]
MQRTENRGIPLETGERRPLETGERSAQSRSRVGGLRRRKQRASGLRRREQRVRTAEGSGGGSRGCGELRWRERRAPAEGEAEAAHSREKV